MFAKTKLMAVGILAFALSCNQSDQDSKDMLLNETIPTADTSIPASSAAVEDNADSSRKFIRTANLKFKVKNVFEATNTIEDITANHGGFVTFTNLSSSTEDIVTRKVSEDSLLETTHFSVSNSITIRIPNQTLDTVLKDISRNIAHLDYRIIKADDVSLQILANRQTKDRNLKSEGRLHKAVEKSGKNLDDIVDAEEEISYKGEKVDQSNIANMDLADKINFSTVSLEIYQRQMVKTELIPTYKNVDEYKPGFGAQMKESLQVGAVILESLVIAIVKIWPLIFIALIILFFYRKKESRIKKIINTA